MAMVKRSRRFVNDLIGENVFMDSHVSMSTDVQLRNVVNSVTGLIFAISGMIIPNRERLTKLHQQKLVAAVEITVKWIHS